jgi:tetratricopeptide (TPR) repeat protein
MAIWAETFRWNERLAYTGGVSCEAGMKKGMGVTASLLLAAIVTFGADPAAEKLVDGGHWKRLRALAEPRVAANPNDAEALYYLGRAKQEQGDLQGAMGLAEKAVAASPNSARCHLLVAEVAIELGQKAGIFKGMSLAHRFRDEAEKALTLDPKYIDARESLMEFYFDAPGIAGGDKKKVREAAGEIAKIDAVRGFLAQAVLAEREKNGTKEAEFYEKALAAAPHDGRVLREAAAFYSSDRQKKYELAEKYALEALKLDEDQVGPYVVLAVAYASAERWKDLDAIMERSEKNVPDDFGPYYQAGKVLLLSGKDLPRAERYFRKYLTMEPEGRDPNHAAAHWRLGLVLEKEGRKPQAVNEMEEAVRLQADFKEAKEDLKRLKK